jgi:hypothetical protein
MTRTQALMSAVAIAVAVGCMGGVAWIHRPRPGEAGGRKADVYRPTLFALLAFPYHPPPKLLPGIESPPRPDPFPPQVRALDGERISIIGYMAPLSMKIGRIDSFYLSRGVFSCCFADAPKMTDYIRVTMAPGLFAPNVDLVRVNGLLEVGEERNSLGHVESVYRMTAETVIPEASGESGWPKLVAWGIGGLFFLALFGPAGLRLIQTVRERNRVVPTVTNEAING